ncbi:MAG: DUF6377 domain-containing protein [Breznakibacter sp.]
MLRIAAVLFFFFSVGLIARPQNVDSLLNVLDTVIAHRDDYRHGKESELALLKSRLAAAVQPMARYMLCDSLLGRYLSYNTDSALHYAEIKQQLALAMGDNRLWSETQLNLALVLCTSGSYKESVDRLGQIDVQTLDSLLKKYYYHVNRTVYGAMADYATASSDRWQYHVLTSLYRDSILLLAGPTTREYAISRSDQLIVQAKYHEALALLHGIYPSIPDDSHDKAIVAYLLYDAYWRTGDKQTAKGYLIQSAIADIRSVVKEYISLWQLATLLFEEGDIDRAYNYLTCSLEDATFSNARLRTLKISQVYPLIDKAYQAKLKEQHHRVVWLLAVSSVLSLLLVLAVVLVSGQMRRLSAARKQLSEANRQLSATNVQLSRSNLMLSEAGVIKETYIGRYMDLCSAYIEKMDDYRRMLNKMAIAGKIDKLFQSIKSSRLIDNELREFYANFDDSFLRLFPSFVDDFNSLLNENEKVYPKPGERLNTELRIFALIRLGITDSEQIAHFLRYSLTTIYNYRTKVRNKASGPRGDFEGKVMQIGVLKN